MSSSVSTQHPFTQLPIAESFANCIDLPDLLKLSETSHFFRNVYRDNLVWQHIARRINLDISLENFGLESYESPEPGFYRSFTYHYVRKLNTLIKAIISSRFENDPGVIFWNSFKSKMKDQTITVQDINNGRAFVDEANNQRAERLVPRWNRQQATQHWAQGLLNQGLLNIVLHGRAAPATNRFELSMSLFDVPEVFRNNARVTNISMHSIGLEWIPDTLTAMSHLIEIDFSENRVAALTSKWSQCSSLEVLKAQRNCIRKVFPGIERLRHLHTLYLPQNKLQAIGPVITSILSLRELNLESNPIGTIGPEIGRLQLLEKLVVDVCGLTCVDEAITTLRHLKWLDLRANLLDTIPEGIFHLPMLETLLLTSNIFQTLPRDIRLPQLDCFDASHNQIRLDDDAVMHFGRITTLKLFNNRLHRWPQMVGIGQLTEMNLADNQLTEMTRDFARCPLLQILSLDYNLISVIPNEIALLYNLRHLQLSDNRITELPPVIGQLAALTELQLNTNQIARLPPEIGGLQQINQLGFNQNLLTSLPQQMSQLTNLRGLMLDDNQFTEIPRVILTLNHGLLYIHIKNNPLGEIHEDFHPHIQEIEHAGGMPPMPWIWTGRQFPSQAHAVKKRRK